MMMFLIVIDVFVIFVVIIILCMLGFGILNVLCCLVFVNVECNGVSIVFLNRGELARRFKSFVILLILGKNIKIVLLLVMLLMYVRSFLIKL